jgi:hypothetical protein
MLNSFKNIVLISLGALVVGHSMINTYVPNLLINAFGLAITTFVIYNYTLKKNDIFSFIMVIYVCSFFPYLQSRGGAFNFVAFVCIIIFYIQNRRLPYELKAHSRIASLLIGLIVFSSIIGWLSIFEGTISDFIYSFLSLFGIVFLFLVTNRIVIDRMRIILFIRINIFIVIYNILASINQIVNFFPFVTPMMPVYGQGYSHVEGGGVLAVTPLYGEYSMIVAILFLSFLVIKPLFSGKSISSTWMVFALFLAVVNILLSISRSVLLLAVFGSMVVYMLQYKIMNVKIMSQLYLLIVMLLIGLGIITLSKNAGIGYTFERMVTWEDKNVESGGISSDRILDGSAFNRDIAFDAAYQKYKSRESWIFGYGYGLRDNNRVAFFTDSSIPRLSAHSQYIALLFLFGWVGLIAYLVLYLFAIRKSWQISGLTNISLTNRYFAFFSMISLSLFLINEIKVDSIFIPNYFAVTMIFLGLAYANINSTRRLKEA